MASALAVIAAAGRGTRFLPCTKTIAKELLPVYDRPVIHHLVEEVAAAGITEVIVVTRPGTEEALRRYFSFDPGWDQYLSRHGKGHLLTPLYDLVGHVHISFVNQAPDLPYGNGAPILTVQDRLTSPFVYLYGDDLVLEQPLGQSLQALLACYDSADAAAVVGAYRVSWESISQVGSIAYRAGTAHQVDRILEKPEPHTAPSNVTPIGRLVLSPLIVSVLESLVEQLEPGRELWMTDALSILATKKTVLAPEIQGQWLTTGDPANLLRAALAFSEGARTS